MFSSGFEASASGQVLHDVHNTLYNETRLSNAHYFQAVSSETPAGHLYEVATSAVVKEEFPYETPAPLGTYNAGTD